MSKNLFTFSKNYIMNKIFNFVVIALIFSSCINNGKDRNSDDRKMDKEIERLISQMTLEEKVGMIHSNSKFSSAGVPRLNIPDWQMADGPHGIREEISRDSWEPLGWTTDSASYFPTGTALAATWNPGLAYLEGQALGEEARWRGKDVLFGPAINIHRTPLCGRNFEYMSEDPFLISMMCVPLIKGIQSKDVAACVKHYLANNQEANRSGVDVEMSERALHEIYLPGFKAAVEKGGVYAIMGAYNKFRGTWCCENEYLLKEILRNECGFEGVMLSDYGAVHSVESAVTGLDMENGTNKSYDQYYFADTLLKAVQDGKISEVLINEKVGRILRVMMKTHVIEGQRAEGSLVTPEHFQTAYKVAKEAIVLLKNDNQMLPVRPEKIKSIAVIGDNATRKHAHGGNSSGVKAKYEITPLAGLKSCIGPEVTLNIAQGYLKSPISRKSSSKFVKNKEKEQLLREQAVKKASSSDIAIIFGGLNHDFDTEGYDRPDMELPYDQERLIRDVVRANPNTILVLTAGAPVNLSGINDIVPAIVWGWYDGMEGGNALADVLLGTVNPSGKLPFTIPVSLEDSPAHALQSYSTESLQASYKEDILVGYRWFDTKNIKPLYPFGHGLSYTTFQYSDLNIDKETYQQSDTIHVSCCITNTGNKDGAETIQLYVSDPECPVLRPTKELKAFKKVSVKVGKIEDVVLDIAVKDLSYYDEEVHGFVVDPGNFILSVGSSSGDIRLKKELRVL